MDPLSSFFISIISSYYDQPTNSGPTHYNTTALPPSRIHHHRLKQYIGNRNKESLKPTMFNKVALSLLFTVHVHNVTANQRGDECGFPEFWCSGKGLHCHTVSWNGRYRRDKEGKLLKLKRCTLEREVNESEGEICISDHECNYKNRHKYKNDDIMHKPKLVCDIDDTSPDSWERDTWKLGKCRKPKAPHPRLKVGEEDLNIGNHGMACRKKSPWYSREKTAQCNTGYECMHPHKVNLDGCYFPASTLRDGERCLEDVECMGGSKCQDFLVPKFQLIGKRVRRKPKDAPGYSTPLCAPKGSPTVYTWVRHPTEEGGWKAVEVTAVDNSATIQPDSAHRTVAPHHAPYAGADAEDGTVRTVAPDHAPYGADADDGKVTTVSPISEQYSETDVGTVATMHTSVPSTSADSNDN